MSASSESPIACRLDGVPKEGRLHWIGLRVAPRGTVQAVSHVEVIADHGLAGDYRARRAGGKRQVTLIQQEHLEAVAALLALPYLAPHLTRRNLVTAGIDLRALHDRPFWIGETLLEGTGYCDPCSRMEATLGRGGHDAMRGYGGITARVLTGGLIVTGDRVRPYAPALAREIRAGQQADNP